MLRMAHVRAFCGAIVIDAELSGVGLFVQEGDFVQENAICIDHQNVRRDPRDHKRSIHFQHLLKIPTGIVGFAEKFHSGFVIFLTDLRRGLNFLSNSEDFWKKRIEFQRKSSFPDIIQKSPTLRFVLSQPSWKNPLR